MHQRLIFARNQLLNQMAQRRLLYLKGLQNQCCEMHGLSETVP